MSKLQRIPLTISCMRSRLRNLPDSHRVLRLLVQCLFLASTVGIPVGKWSLERSDGPSPWCKCATTAKTSGSCCCASRNSSSSRKSCCSLKESSHAVLNTGPVGGCCSAKNHMGVPNRSRKSPAKEDQSKSPIAWKSTCHCGPIDSAILLVCAEPRLRPEPVGVITRRREQGSHVCDYVTALSGQRSRPPVPPPRFGSAA